MGKIKLLIVSLYYPPIESIASYRIEAFAKYLDKRKFEIDIITLKSRNSLSYEEKGNVRIFRIVNSALFRPFTFGERSSFWVHKSKVLWNLILDHTFGKYSKWKKEAFKKVLELHKLNKYDIVLSSFAPVESHLVALLFKKVCPNIKWIADMRDELSDNQFIPRFLRRRYRNYEKEILMHCDVLTTVSGPILENFKEKVRGLNREILFSEIRNGFDFEINLKTFNNYRKNSKFTISYTGSFYGARNPNNLFKALIKLEDRILKNILIKFVGLMKPISVPDKLRANVKVIPKVSHSNAIKIMQESDALLLIHPKGRKGVYTGKLFEYLGSLRPIIALVDKNDVAASLIRDANAGYIADFDDIEEIKMVIRKAYDNWKSGVMPNFNIHIIEEHHRRNQVKKLEELILEELYSGES